MERRLVLDPTHWLIATVALTDQAALIEDTDIVRPQLSRAPLAAWKHLLAVPIPGIRAMLILARSPKSGVFTEKDLSVAVPLATEAATLLGDALQIRELARRLMILRDDDETLR